MTEFRLPLERTEPKYDLERRTLCFSRAVLYFIRHPDSQGIHKTILNQLFRAASSVGANYIEANESLSRKDLLYRLKICRKEAKEAGYWLRLIELPTGQMSEYHGRLLGESKELMMIFGASIRTLTRRYFSTAQK